jgi:hypothetical protein
LEIIHANLGALRLAIELRLVESVLSVEQAASLELLDPREALGEPHASIQHVGLLRSSLGQPMGLCLGEVCGVSKLDASQIYPLPAWLMKHHSALLYPACVLDRDQRLRWLLNPRPLWL